MRMRHAISSAFVAWLGFVVVCLVPAWTLRNRIAVQAQLRFERTLSERPTLRALDAAARDELCRVLLEDPCRDRRQMAAGLLRSYDDPIAFRARFRALRDPDRQVINAAWGPSQPWCWRRASAGAAIDGLTDEEMVRLLQDPPDFGVLQMYFYVLCHLRPERCEHVLARVLRETGDLEFAQEVVGATQTLDHDPFVHCEHYAEISDEMLVSAIKAGTTNPNAEVRDWATLVLHGVSSWQGR